MDNKKKIITLNIGSPCINLSANSPVILSELCTSTPKDSLQLSIIKFKPGFDSIKENGDTYLNLNNIIDSIPIPIFGRRNMKLLNNCVNADPRLQSPEAVKSLLQNKKTFFLNENNINSNLLHLKKEYYEDNSTSFTYKFRKELKQSQKKKLNISNNTLKACRVISLKKDNHSRIKKCLNQSKKKSSMLKISSKSPKAPLLLTAIRAELRQNRNRLDSEIEKANNFLKLPISNESLKKTEAQGNKIRKIKQVRCNKIQPTDVIKKYTAFKAWPIRKYMPLPIMKKKNITIPQSPKFCKRKLSSRHHCCSNFA